MSIIQECVSTIDIPTKVFHTCWEGLGHARNIVVANAEGDFIVWVDGDMMLSTDFVRKLVEFMERAPYYVRKLVIFIEQHPEAGITKGKQSLEPGGNLLATLEAYLRAVSSIVDYKSEKTRSKALGTGGSIYRVEAIEQVGGFDQNIRGYGEDWDVEMQSEQQVGHCVRLTLNFLITRDIN